MFRDLASLTSGKLLGSVIGLFAFTYLARVLEPTYYGYVELATWITLLGAMVIDAGLGTIGAREISHSPDQALDFAAKIPGCRLLIALVVTPLVALFPLVTDQPYEATVIIGMFALSLLAIPWKNDWLFQGLEMMGVSAYSHTFRMSVFTVGILLLVNVQSDFMMVGVVEVVAVASMVAFFFYFQHTRVSPIRLRFSWAFFRQYVPQGLSLGVSSLIWTAIQAMPMLFLATFAGDEETAWFAAPQRIVVSLLALSSMYHYNLYPTLTRRYHRNLEAMNDIVAASLRVISWGTIGGALVLALLSEPLLELVFGTRFGTASPTFAVLVWGLPVTLLSGHFRWALVAAGKERYVLYIHVLGLAAMGIGAIILIPLLQSVGAAFSMLASSVTILVSAYVFYWIQLPAIPSFRIALAPTLLAAGLYLGLPLLTINIWLIALLAICIFLAFAFLDRRLLRDTKRLIQAKADVDTGVESV